MAVTHLGVDEDVGPVLLDNDPVFLLVSPVVELMTINTGDYIFEPHCLMQGKDHVHFDGELGVAQALTVLSKCKLVCV